MNSKLVIVQDYNDSNFFWKRLIKKYDNLQVVINQYNGFEGNCVKCIAGNDIHPENIQSLITEYKNIIVNKIRNYRLLFISTKNTIINDLEATFNFIGYEYGFFKDDLNIYSSLFHEIILGHIPALLSFKSELNDNFLFQYYEIANKYMTKHTDLFKNGEDVENKEGMVLYKIWKYH